MSSKGRSSAPATIVLELGKSLSSSTKLDKLIWVPEFDVTVSIAITDTDTTMHRLQSPREKFRGNKDRR